MRLRRLAMARYGKFTDRVIDFGEAQAGMPDLHVVHGPNEAGKSTLFSGYLDLLFGIELQTRYGFLHSYDTMRVGGCLELASGPQELMRIKKPQPTLRDASNQPVAQALLAGALGGLDRASYRTMFSLDDDTLESGGDSILASNGELGQLLFSASAGLAELSKTLLQLRAAADEFTRPHARSGDLAKLKAALATLKQERDVIDTQASAFFQLARARDDAVKAYGAVLDELSTKRTEAAQVRRLRAGLPRMTAWNGLQIKLERFADLPTVPEGWHAGLAELERAEPLHRVATTQATAEVMRLEAAIQDIPVDEAALARLGRLTHLETHVARNLTAELDLRPRRADLVRADEAIRGILARIGQEGEADPAQLLLTTAQSTVLDDLTRRRSGIEASLRSAEGELADAAETLSEARRRLEEEGGATAPGGLTYVTAALAALRASDHPQRVRTAGKARDQHSGKLATQLFALRPWAGDAAELANLLLPDEATLQAWQDDARKADAFVAACQEQVERLETELALRTAELKAMDAVANLPSDQDAVAVRATREAAWARHRHGLDAATADAFEAALRRDDVVSAGRLGYERDLAKLQETTLAVRLKEAELTNARLTLARARDDQDQRASDLQSALEAVSPAFAELSVPEFSRWATRRQEAVASMEHLREAEREVDQARADGNALCILLRRALERAGIPFDPADSADMLAVAAQDGLDRDARRQLLHRDVESADRTHRSRRAALDRAMADDQQWGAAWLAACSECWLGPAAAAMPFDVVQAIVAEATELRAALEKRSDLARRVHDMEADQAAFGEEVGRLATELAISLEGRSGPDLAKSISDRVREATRAQDERKRLQQELAQAQDKERKVLHAAKLHAGKVGEMTDVLKVASLLEVAGKLRDIHDKADLERQVALVQRDILAELDVATLAEAQGALTGQSIVALEAEEATLAAHILELEQRARKLFADQQGAIDRITAVGGDDAVARIEERRRTLLLEIEDKAQHYLRLRVGIAAADRALRAYRDQHRSSMMQHASEAFRLISRGAYRGLGTQPGKDGDVLVALGADGGSKLAADLSKGTRFQLYLALRAAGYREFAKLRPAVPFIADDIMETFDDHRAEETLRLLGEMSRLGQVIYLTHHGHLRDIAERTVPGVRLHELA